MDGEYDFHFDPPLECWSFDAQVLGILYTLQLSAQDVADSKLLFNDIVVMVNNIWPGSTVKVFGSFITTLAFKNSDMDCFIQLPAHCEDEVGSCWKKIYRRVDVKHTAFEVESCTPWAPVPVITLSHSETGRKCDLTFNSSITLDTCKVIKYLLKLDTRARQLAMLIKYWAKVNKLIGTHLLSNHAITLLVIFFLQYKKILPSVASLQENAVINMTDGWNTAFDPLFYQSGSCESLYSLLGGFFTFYQNFSFDSYAVCPYLGFAVHVSRFSNVNNLPNQLRLYGKRVSQGECKPLTLRNLCIQDIFKHDKNCAVCISNELVERLTICFLQGSFCFHLNSESIFLKELLKLNTRKCLRGYEDRDPRYIVFEPEYQVSVQQGRSWKFYFFIAALLFISYYFLTNNK